MTSEPTPSRQIAADLRKAIRDGEYRPGHQLPSGNALARRYGVARQTVQTAVQTLRAEGLVVGHQGAGWFVREKPAVQRLASSRLKRSEREAGRGAFTTDAAQGGWRLDSQVTLRVEPACELIATELRIEAGAEVFVRDRVMSADGQPVQLATSRLPRTLTEGTAIERENPGPGGIYARLEEAGHILTRFEERVTARPATADESEVLRLDIGAPVLTITRVAYAGELPTEINDMILAAERYELVYDLPAD
ncbi:MAG: GntR family transcriptional regulator [Pseudonocardiaceae bacterium]